ncbi:MAG: N-acetyltransferase [Beijerinckiaceae bacterium]|nr:MAG: N-acetyltransferase [Beijerinckiaceae bacterium]
MFPDLFRDDVFTLETPRLFLRWPKATDAPAIATLAGDRRVSEMTAPIPHPYPVEEAMRYVIASRAANAEGKGLALAIAARDEPSKLIGNIGLRLRPEGDLALGYWLGVPYWGNGYVTEAAQAIVDAAFLYSGAQELMATVRVTNPASRRVLEHCGFQYEGGGMALRPAWGDSVPVDTYRLNRSLWASLKGWRAPVPYGREVAVGGM